MLSPQRLNTLKEIDNTAIKTESRASVILCGFFWQLQPVSGTFPVACPLHEATECARRALSRFGPNGENNIRHFWQDTEQMKYVDECETKACTQCFERRDSWNQPLTPNGHGCSVCKNVFDKGFCNRGKIERHRRKDADLVCPGCEEQGYSPGKRIAYQCTNCLKMLGSLKFNKHQLCAARIHKQSKLVRLACASLYRCSKCRKSYEAKCWRKSELRNHRSYQNTALVCKDCRSGGYHPSHLTAYTCQTCRLELGGLRFKRDHLKNYKRFKVKKLECKQYATAARNADSKLQALQGQEDRVQAGNCEFMDC